MGYEQWARSNEQRAMGYEQWARSNEQRAMGYEQWAMGYGQKKQGQAFPGAGKRNRAAKKRKYNHAGSG
jgi:hypothetical protein